MSAVEPYGQEYRDEDWPHGLRCARCDRLVEEGDRYASEWQGFQDDIPILLIVCLECVLRGTEERMSGRAGDGR